MKRFFKTRAGTMLKVSEISGYESDCYSAEGMLCHGVIIYMESGLKFHAYCPDGEAVKQEIYAIEHASQSEAKLIRDCLSDESLAQQSLSEVIQIVNNCGALDYSREQARARSQQALNSLSTLPPSEYRDAMELMADFAVNRNR